MGLESIKIGELLDKIESGEVLLPDLQREFVWNNIQVRDFIESIYKKYPVGMLLMWEAPEGDIPLMGIEGNISKKSRIRYLIIDGQQRSTSLLFVRKGELTHTRRKREINLLFNPIKEEFELSNANIEEKCDWFSVTNLLNGSIMSMIDRDKLKKDCLLTDERIDKEVISRLEDLKGQLTKETIPIFKISSSVEYEEVAEIFVRINSKGTRIRITELLLALFSIKIPGEFKKDVYNYLNELSDRNWELDVSILIKSLVCLTSETVRMRYFRDNADKITEEMLKNSWLKTKEHINHILSILEENLGIRSSDLLPSENVLVPLVAYLEQKKGRLNPADVNKMISWFLLASYWSRYTGSTESRLDEDIKAIIKSKDLEPAIKNIRQQSGRLLLDEDSFKGKGNDKLLFLYVVSRNNGASDWFRGHLISTSDFELHHIFPKSILKRMDIETALIDDVANIAFLTQKANRKISNLDPSAYLQTLDKEVLKKQFVPIKTELWDKSNYDTFLKERRKLIIFALNDYLKKLGIHS